MTRRAPMYQAASANRKAESVAAGRSFNADSGRMYFIAVLNSPDAWLPEAGMFHRTMPAQSALVSRDGDIIYSGIAEQQGRVAEASPARCRYGFNAIPSRYPGTRPGSPARRTQRLQQGVPDNGQHRRQKARSEARRRLGIRIGTTGRGGSRYAYRRTASAEGAPGCRRSPPPTPE